MLPVRTPVAQIAEEVQAAVLPPGATLLLAVSALTFGARAQLRRVGVFAVCGPTLSPLVDTLVDASQGEALHEALASVASVEIGGWDAHFADGWSWVWGRTRDRVAVWHRDRGLVATAMAGGLALHGMHHAWADIDHVETWASADRVDRMVRLPRPDAEPLAPVVVRDLTAEIDPSYDRVMLDAETTWMVELAQALASALNKPFFDARGLTN